MIIKQLLVIFSVCWLAACSTESSKSYYQLPSLVTGVDHKSQVPADKQVHLISVNLADALNGQGIVYQTSDVQYIVAANNLWVGNLQQQLQQSLVENLNAELPGWLITSHAMTGNKKSLTVNVTAFNGRYDGAVIVKGDWILADDDLIITKSFAIQLSQSDNGYESLVRTLAQAWKQQSDDMARVIAKIE